MWVAAYRLGLGRFGENRIEELEAKAPEVARILAGPAPSGT
jgi:uncharacterized pyridoxal phosphate-containing UPF0001 family protein